MKTIRLTLAVALLGLGLSTAAYAQGVAKGDRAAYGAAKKQAEADYEAAKVKCDALGSSIEKENCIGIARDEQKLRKAQAEAQYKPNEKNMRDARIAAANLDYAKAKAKCEAMGGHAKETGSEASVCMNKAAEARSQAIAVAKAQKKADEKGVPVKPGSSMDTRGDIGKE